MKKFAVLLVAVGALFYFKPGLLGFGHHGAFDEKGNPQVLLFTQSACGASCAQALADLKRRGVSFQEIELSDDKAIERYRSLGGDGRIPMLAVGDAVVRGHSKGEYASALAQNFGDTALTRAERMLFSRHFNSQGKPLVYMYGATWCGYCKELRADMARRHIEFVEIDVDRAQDRTFIEQVMDLSAIPVIYVGYERIVGGGKADEVVEALRNAPQHQG